MLAGYGQQCNIKTFISKSIIKTKNENGDDKNNPMFTNEKRNCDCCLII